MLTLKLLKRGQCVPLVCMGKARFGGITWGEVVMMHAQNFPISRYFLPTYHMSMSSELLAPGTGVFYL